MDAGTEWVWGAGLRIVMNLIKQIVAMNFLAIGGVAFGWSFVLLIKQGLSWDSQ